MSGEGPTPPPVRVTGAGWTVAAAAGPVLCVATSTRRAADESTFIRAHMARLPARVTVLSGLEPPPLCEEGRPVAPSAAARLARAASRRLLHLPLAAAQDVAIARHLKRRKARAVLAEFGPTGAWLLPACRLAGLPLVVHFHGYDASVTRVVAHHGGYAELLAGAAAVVAVSRRMEARLLELGAPREKLHYNPYGVDTVLFAGADPLRAPPLFVAVGRFVEKKAPEVTLLAFDRCRRQAPEARLVMVGDGPLLGPCTRLARELGLGETVRFAGALPAAEVAAHLAQARAFVQHSLTARDGDAEGLPLAVLEASSAGLPVVATRHGGIPDAVLEGETGHLVDEGDAAAMAAHMARLALDPAAAARLGHAGRRRIRDQFTTERSLAGLWRILEDAAAARRTAVLRSAVDSLPAAARRT